MNDLSISNNVRHNIKRILNENRTLKQQDFADAIDMTNHNFIECSTRLRQQIACEWLEENGTKQIGNGAGATRLSCCDSED